MKLVIFGTGNNAKRFICEMNHTVEIVCFLDNDKMKQKEQFCGKEVVPPNAVRDLEYDYLIIAAMQIEEIEKQLIELGVDYKKIIYSYGTYEYSYAEFMDTQLWKFYTETYAIRIMHQIVQEEYEKVHIYQADRLLATDWLFLKVFGRKFDRNLSTLNDKIRYLELYVYGNLEKLCTDKYAVRKYVDYLGLSETLPELYFVKDSVSDIDFESEDLPNKFILKVNNGCGLNIICRDKNKFDYEYAKFRLKKWMNKRHELFAYEFHYENIPPKIVCEELLEMPDKSSLIDYKYFCCNGKIVCILVCTERDLVTGESFHYYFDKDWNQLDYAIGVVRQVPAKDCTKPGNLYKMNEVAEKLANVFPFVRVDLYNINGKIYFGELTFSPCGGVITIQSDEAQKIIGQQIDVNYKSGENERLYKILKGI